jgi:hypothetical protein
MAVKQFTLQRRFVRIRSRGSGSRGGVLGASRTSRRCIGPPAEAAIAGICRNPISFPIFLEAIQLMLQREEWILNVSPCPVGATTSACGHGNRSGERGVRKMPGKTHAPLQMKLPFDHLIGDGDERPTEINPPLFDRDGKTADQPCDHLQVPAVLVFEQSGEPLNTFIVAAQKRFAIDLSFSL